jgi:hypothetical protein
MPSGTGGCLQPVLLRGRADYIDGGTGELIHRYTTVHEPGGVLPIACKTRRASRCPPCAEVYRADTYQLIRAGLAGGKGIPATVADHPCVFVTLTAPSFGPVHVRREKDGRVLACRPRRKDKTCAHGIRLSCRDKHDHNDHRLGEYATKAAECTGTLDRRITPADRIADLPVREHGRRHIAVCLRLGKLPQLRNCGWPLGRTCSASAATSPPRAASTPSPSAHFAPTAPPTSASTPSPPGCNPTSTPAPRSS